jgi:alpha/beta superfamily hydrolase
VTNDYEHRRGPRRRRVGAALTAALLLVLAAGVACGGGDDESEPTRADAELVTVEDLRALARQVPPEARVRVEVIPGAGHFFDEQLEDLRRVIAGWAEERLREG